MTESSITNTIDIGYNPDYANRFDIFMIENNNQIVRYRITNNDNYMSTNEPSQNGYLEATTNITTTRRQK